MDYKKKRIRMNQALCSSPSRNDNISLNHFIITFIPPPPPHHLHRPHHPHLLCKQLCVFSSRYRAASVWLTGRKTKYIERGQNVNAENSFVMSCIVLHWLELLHCIATIQNYDHLLKTCSVVLHRHFKSLWQQERQREMRLTRQHVWHLNGLTY